MGVGDILPVKLKPVPAGLPSDLISRRPDLAAAERRLASAFAGVKSAKRSLYPQISLTGSGGTSSNLLKDLLNGNFGIWSMAGSILQPIFQGGKLRAKLKNSKSQLKLILAEYRRAVLNALSEVETALSDVHHLAQQEAALKQAANQSEAVRRLAGIQYKQGVIDFLTMLESIRSAYDTRSQLVNVKLEHLNTRIDLYLALGGGFSVKRIKDEKLPGANHERN